MTRQDLPGWLLRLVAAWDWVLWLTFDSRWGLWILLPLGGAVGFFSGMWPLLRWWGLGVLVVLGAGKIVPYVLDMFRDLKVKYPPADFWTPGTPLSQQDEPPPETPVKVWSKANLDSLLPPPKDSAWTWFDLYVPAYGRTMRFTPALKDRWEGLQPRSVTMINEVLDWTAEERARVRELMVAYGRDQAEARGYDDGPDGSFLVSAAEIEDLVLGARFSWDETEETDHRLMQMELTPPWDEEHGLVIIVRDGKPFAAWEADVHLSDFDNSSPSR